jgi:uncharacterized membrane protein YhaH (DUF805 family)
MTPLSAADTNSIDARDQFVLGIVAWPIVVAVTVGVLNSVLMSLKTGAILLFQLTVILSVISSVFFAISRCARAFRKWQPRRGTSIILALLVCPPMLYVSGWELGPRLHLALTYPYYATQINGKTLPTKFDWGGHGFVGATVDRELLFDPSSDLETVARNYAGGDRNTRVWHLWGHWYLGYHYS